MQKIKLFFSQLLLFLKKRWKLVLVIIVVLALIGGYVINSKAKEAEKNKLNFISPEIGSINKVLEISGVVDATQKARLSFALGGKVVYLPFKEGDFINKGATIATIDRKTLEKQLQQDLNFYMQQRLQWENVRDIYVEDAEGRDKPIPLLTDRRYVQTEQLNLDNSVLNVEIRDIAIRNTILSAPFAGILTKSPTTTTGVQLSAGEFFELVDPTSLVFRALVDEVDIANIKESQPAQIMLDAFEKSPIESNITYISFTNSSSPTTNGFIVEFPLTAKNDLPLRIGMTGDAKISLIEKNNILKVPLNATRQRDGKTYVDVKITDTTFQERQIEVGIETDDEVEVIEGLNKDDLILLPD